LRGLKPVRTLLEPGDELLVTERCGKARVIPVSSKLRCSACDDSFKFGEATRRWSRHATGVLPKNRLDIRLDDGCADPDLDRAGHLGEV
jgi:hypothetical protein